MPSVASRDNETVRETLALADARVCVRGEILAGLPLVQLLLRRAHSDLELGIRFHGYRMKFRPLSYDSKVLYDIFVKRVYGAIPRNCSIVDIGAHIGIFTLYCCQARALKVLAFEPESKNFKLLMKNVQANHLSNVHAFRLGVWSRNETKILFTTSGSGFHSFYPANNHIGGSETISCVGINTVLDPLESPVFIKIDAEGSEYEIINHIKSRNTAKISGMVLEYHLGNPVLRASFASLLQCFTSNGFRVNLDEDSKVLTAMNKNRASSPD